MTFAVLAATSFVTLAQSPDVSAPSTATPVQETIALSSAPVAALPASDAETYKQAFTSGELHNADGTTLPYRLLKPGAAPTGNLPLVILLHGSDKMGTDNQAQLDGMALAWAQPKMQAAYPAFVLAPQFATRSANYGVSPVDQQLAASPGKSLLPLFDLIDQMASTLPIDRNRVYLVGFSMGASTAWEAILLHPERFAAAVSLSAVPPARILAASFAQTPLLIAHGDADSENPYAPDLAMFVALGAESKARFRTYAGMGHMPPPDFADPASTWWRDWLFSQHRTQAAALQ